MLLRVLLEVVNIDGNLCSYVFIFVLDRFQWSLISMILRWKRFIRLNWFIRTKKVCWWWNHWKLEHHEKHWNDHLLGGFHGFPTVLLILKNTRWLKWFWMIDLERKFELNATRMIRSVTSRNLRVSKKQTMIHFLHSFWLLLTVYLLNILFFCSLLFISLSTRFLYWQLLSLEQDPRNWRFKSGTPSIKVRRQWFISSFHWEFLYGLLPLFLLNIIIVLSAFSAMVWYVFLSPSTFWHHLYVDHITLEDYEIHDGMGLELWVFRCKFMHCNCFHRANLLIHPHGYCCGCTISRFTGIINKCTA